MDDLQDALQKLATDLEGTLEFDSLHRQIYATDASLYRELPTAVAFPKSETDVQRLIQFANKHHIGLIPRTAGTSLAGQVVGSGIVVDIGKHFRNIGPIDEKARTVVVQPGVVRDELNLKLKPLGLMFGPETSTSNRAMIGGMLGNNSCGSNSIVYGTMRDQTIEVTGFLSDGSQVTWGPTDAAGFNAKCEQPDLEGAIHQSIKELLSPEACSEIQKAFPKASIHRRNTGYALDALADCEVLEGDSVQGFNFSKLLAGSEGTLLFTTSIKLKLHPLPPAENGLLCVHFESVDEALRANAIAMQHPLFASELIDRLVIDGASRNLALRDNLGFIQGQPGAILILSLRGHHSDQVAELAKAIESDLRAAGLGYAWPLMTGDDIKKVWDVRKAGLGVVANVVGDRKPSTVIEDTAVTIEDLPNYISDVDRLLDEKYQCRCVYYAHAGSGEIHLRPVLNLKTAAGVKKFRDIARDVAALVKKYRGSLSGEHGDGRLRAEFLETMVGPVCYQMMRQVKTIFDPHGIFNPGKIVDAPPMDQALRSAGRPETLELETVLDFDSSQGIQRAAEMCSGSGDCRKSALIGGTMCPSYMATGNEKDSTRARANVLREALASAANSPTPVSGNPLVSEVVREAMDLCLSCKGCKKECPSNVDVGKMKAEFQQAWQDQHGVSRRTKIIASIDRMNRMASKVPRLANFLMGNGLTGGMFKRFAGFATARSMPTIAKQSFEKWFAAHQSHANAGRLGKVHFFADEFTNFNDPQTPIAAVEVLERLGWEVLLLPHLQSGRAMISKGLLRDAKQIAAKNVRLLDGKVTADCPLVGVEPSAILTFRDEYPDLLSGADKEAAKRLGASCLTFEEFLASALEDDKIDSSGFDSQQKTVRLHGHCHEKALIGLVPSIRVLSLPENYRVRIIASGCCGMAGSFGYEAEHYEVSMQIGELVLFPVVRDEPVESLIAATGVSCRHQILDGTQRVALHPARILRDALV